MSDHTYVLIPGAASGPWYWHRVVDQLCQRGPSAIAVDLPCDDDEAGLGKYADAVVKSAGGHDGLILVAHSLGGFVAPLVCDRLDVDLIVLVTAMVPAPGETPAQWWANTGYDEAKWAEAGQHGRAVDPFFDDVEPALADAARKRERRQSATPMDDPWPLDAWPDVATKVVLCREDRFFPPDFMRRVVKTRLGITPDEINAGHMPMLSRPRELADQLESYRTSL